MPVIDITEETFADETARGRCLVLFGAAWNDASELMRPLVEELAGDFPAWRFGFVNFDEEQACALANGVNTIPTLLSFREGRLDWKRTGAVPIATLRALLQSAQG